MKVHSSALLKSSIQHNKLYKASGALEGLFRIWFDGLVYNQIWEDPEVDSKALELSADSRLMTISSGGCNALNYLCFAPCKIIAIDLNQYHMHLTHLKVAALRYLPDYESFFEFFAVAKSKDNVKNYYKYIKKNLNENAQEFWEGGSFLPALFRRRRIDYFSKNFYKYSRSGNFISFLNTVSTLTGGNLNKILTASSLEDQLEHYERWIEPCFQHWLVKFLAKLPISVYSLGIPPQQFSLLKKDGYDGILDLYQARVKRLACSFPICRNYFAWQAFSQSYNTKDQRALPLYLQQKYYSRLRERVDSLETHITSTQKFLASQPNCSLDRFVFLDSLDWMTKNQINVLWQEIIRVSKPDSRIIFRTAGSNSTLDSILAPEILEHFAYEEQISKRLYQEDRSAVYGGFHLYRLKD